MWRDFPQALCDALRCQGIVYDRTSYGQSSPWPVDPGVRYMEIEADEVLPKLLAALAIEDCVLVGHSDGGTIALNYAARDPEPLRAVVTIAAHAITEPFNLGSIVRARAAFEAGDLRQRLARYHGDNVDHAFRLWSDAWLTPGFEPMDADGRLPGVQVPVQAIQGEDDEYGTELQLGIIAGKVGGYCETRLIPGCGHSPHLQQPAIVLAEIARFVAPLALTA
jgi:pimeloyl-ACP methyl ester carboxylesterase